MNNKFLVELYVPSISEVYNLYLPVNRRVGNIITLINKALFEITNGEYVGTTTTCLYDRATGEKLNANSLLRDTSIKNGCSLIII